MKLSHCAGVFFLVLVAIVCGACTHDYSEFEFQGTSANTPQVDGGGADARADANTPDTR